MLWFSVCQEQRVLKHPKLVHQIDEIEIHSGIEPKPWIKVRKKERKRDIW